MRSACFGLSQGSRSWRVECDERQSGSRRNFLIATISRNARRLVRSHDAAEPATRRRITGPRDARHRSVLYAGRMVGTAAGRAVERDPRCAFPGMRHRQRLPDGKGAAQYASRRPACLGARRQGRGALGHLLHRTASVHRLQRVRRRDLKDLPRRQCHARRDGAGRLRLPGGRPPPGRHAGTRRSRAHAGDRDDGRTRQAAWRGVPTRRLRGDDPGRAAARAATGGRQGTWRRLRTVGRQRWPARCPRRSDRDVSPDPRGSAPGRDSLPHRRCNGRARHDSARRRRVVRSGDRRDAADARESLARAAHGLVSVGCSP